MCENEVIVLPNSFRGIAVIECSNVPYMQSLIWYLIYTEKSMPVIILLLILLLGASQVALVVKNLPANAGDIGDSGLIS